MRASMKIWDSPVVEIRMTANFRRDVRASETQQNSRSRDHKLTVKQPGVKIKKQWIRTPSDTIHTIVIKRLAARLNDASLQGGEFDLQMTIGTHAIGNGI